MAGNTVTLIFAGDSEKLEKAFGRAGNAARKFELQARNTGSKMEDAFKSIGRVASGFAIGFGASLVAAGGAAVMFGIKAVASLEQSQIAFTNLLGSAKQSKEFLEGLQKFAAATPFEFHDLTSASQKLLAMGFQAKQIIPIMTSIGDAVAGIGGSAPEIDRVVIALGQMRAKQKISTEEMMQLTELGIPAFQILADKMNMTVPALQDLMSKAGGVGASALFQKGGLDALIDGLEHGTKSFRGFAGMMAQQSTTLSGLWSTFKDNVSMALIAAFQPALPVLKKFLDFATRSIPVAADAIKGFARKFDPVVGVIKSDVVPAVKDLWEWFQDRLIPVLKEAKDNYLAGLITAFAGVKKSLEDSRSQRAEFVDFLEKVNSLFGSPAIKLGAGMFVVGILALSSAFDVLNRQIKLAVDAWNALWNLINGPTKSLKGRNQQNFQPTGQGFHTMFSQRAHGGPVLAGQTYLVGERGPELLTMGGRGGYVTPNGGGTGITVRFGGNTDSAFATAFMNLVRTGLIQIETA